MKSRSCAGQVLWGARGVICFSIWAAIPALAQSGAPVGAPEPAPAAQVATSDSSQAQPPSPPPEKEGYHLEEVVVTATRRESGTQDVPFSISAYSGKTLEAHRTEDLSDLAAISPGITFVPYSNDQQFISIRGASVGTGSVGTEEGVQLFIDDVVTAGMQDMPADIFDIQRIEVLRGPQGTLFGRNVTGGAVLFYNKLPNFRFEGKGDVTAGDFDYKQARAVVSGPLIDETLAGRLTVGFTHGEGTVRDINTGDRLGGQNSLHARGSLLWNPIPSQDLTVLFSADYFHDIAPGKPVQLLGSYVPAAYPTMTFDPNKSFQGDEGIVKNTVLAPSIKIDWATPIGAFTSITGYRHIDQLTDSSAIPGPKPYEPTTQRDAPSRVRQFTQEMRLASPEDQTFTWIGGLYFYNSQKELGENFTFAFPPDSLIGPVFLLGGIPVLPLGPPVQHLIYQRINTGSGAVFGELGLKLFDYWKLAIGGRYTYELKNGYTYLQHSQPLTLPASATYRRPYQAVTPKATLSFRPNDNVSAYATVGRGFKAGGFDIGGYTVGALQQSYKPEYEWNYETGLKFNAFDQRLRGDISVYYAFYKDLQFDTTSSNHLDKITLNAGQTRVGGLETAFTFTPFPWLALSSVYTYVPVAKLSGFDPGNSTLAAYNNKRPGIPLIQGVLSMELIPLRDVWGGDIHIRADTGQHSKVHYQNNHSEPDFVYRRTGYHEQINAQLEWSQPRGNGWSILLWGKNLTDERVITSASADVTSLYLTARDGLFGVEYLACMEGLTCALNPNPGSDWLVTWNNPRTFGVTLSKRF